MTTETIVNNITSKVENVITILGEKLGVGTEHFYPVLVKQQVVEGYISTGFALFSLLFAIGLIIYTLMLTKKEGEKAIGFAFWATIIFGVSAFCLTTSIPQIINPEYYALQEISTLIQRIK